MKTTRLMISAVVVTLLLAHCGFGADDENRRSERRPAERAPAERGLAPIAIPPDVLEKLDLSTQQKEKLEQLHKEFEAKQKEAADKIREQAARLRDELEKARKDNDREAFRQASQKMAELNQGLRSVQADYATKLREILNDEQKKQLEELTARRRAEFTPAPTLLMPGVQERLGLSQEQKDKIARLRKEFEDKAKEVLTDEQRKQLEAMQNRAGGARPAQRIKEPERRER
jgi:Spy/CpxP family protein refolding chaperone